MLLLYALSSVAGGSAVLMAVLLTAEFFVGGRCWSNSVRDEDYTLDSYWRL